MDVLRTFSMLVLVTLIGFSTLHAQETKHTRYYTEDGIAIDGYDPVAYFTKADAVKGDKAFSYDWMEATWHFDSAQNRDAFIANPKKYAPQYRGYCAYAAANNYIYPTDPKAWTVYQGKLYLNAGLGTRIRWALNKDNYIRSADANWPELRTQLP